MYLIQNDYLRQITDIAIQQLVSGNAYLQTQAELPAIKEVSSYLRAKYDVDQEFTDTLLYDPNVSYKANSRVYLNASAYSPTATYVLKSLVLQNGKVYKNIFAIAVPEAFNEAHWQVLGAQWDMFYVSYPQPLFNINAYYRRGDKAFWKGAVYTAVADSRILSHSDALQYGTTGDVPLSNYLPTDRLNGHDQWVKDADYSVPADSLQDDAKWSKGDNRHPQLVMYTIDIAVYHLYSRVAPKAIPDTRENRYNAAIAWLRMTARGETVADIQKLQPNQGGRIRFGSHIKNQNSY